jgi:hypothetical protein
MIYEILSFIFKFFTPISNFLYKMSDFTIQVANEGHTLYAELICQMIETAAQKRGTGIAKRDPEYIRKKMREGKAVIAFSDDSVLAGFCYIETWGHGNYVAHSGLIVNEIFRQSGLAKAIKTKAFELSQEKYPTAKIFGLTTSLPVMKINSELGYKPVTFSELTQDESFWKGCQSCVNYDILTRTNRKHCLCTGMLYDPANKENEKKEETKTTGSWRSFKVYERWLRIKEMILGKLQERKAQRLENKAKKLEAKAQKIREKVMA